MLVVTLFALLYSKETIRDTQSLSSYKFLKNRDKYISCLIKEINPFCFDAQHIVFRVL